MSTRQLGRFLQQNNLTMTARLTPAGFTVTLRGAGLEEHEGTAPELGDALMSAMQSWAVLGAARMAAN
jgi:hypothetical protein